MDHGRARVSRPVSSPTSGLRVVRSRAVPSALRCAHLASLPEPQELFVERSYERSQKFVVRTDGGDVGYAAVDDVTVVELYVADVARTAWRDALDVLVHASGAERVLCKTFDVALFDAAKSRAVSSCAVGDLFRRVDRTVLAGVSPIAGRSATVADIDAILAIHDGFFDDASEIADYIERDGLFVYDELDELLGCGVRRRVIAQLDAVDIGMVVAPRHRGRRLGTRIVADVARRCLVAGDRPICGCASDNVASRRSLEAAGFRTDHALWEICLAPSRG